MMYRAALSFGLIVAAAAGAPAQERLPDGFVFLRDIEPGIAQDMRYAGRNNFVGHPLPGYGGNECILLRQAAEALKRAQADLAPSGLSLKVYDCYRPTRAVRAMAAWSNDGRGDGATKRFFPTLAKTTLFASGYIAAYSLHSSGTAVDLTIVPTSSAPPSFDPAASYDACTAPVRRRAPDNSLDMGTGFDCFDLESHTNSPTISAEAKRSRAILVGAMTRREFKNYFREWWHFAYPTGRPPQQFDFPIPRHP
ncbi:MAG: M15 family metallopeptidase [Pseudolabrys sp.]